MGSGFVDSGTGIVVKDPFFRTWGQDQAGYSPASIEEGERFGKVAGRRVTSATPGQAFRRRCRSRRRTPSLRMTPRSFPGASPAQVQERLPGAAHFFRRAELKVIGQ